MQDTIVVKNSLKLYSRFSSKGELKTLEFKAPADFYQKGHKDRSAKYSFKASRNGVEIKQAQAKAKDKKDNSTTRLTIDF